MYIIVVMKRRIREPKVKTNALNGYACECTHINVLKALNNQGSSGPVFLNNKSNNLDTFVNGHFSYRENVLSMVEKREYSERLNKIENI